MSRHNFRRVLISRGRVAIGEGQQQGETPMTKIRTAASVGLFLFVAYAAASAGYAQVIPGQALDASGAPQYRVDPFWPKPLPNRWSMQQIVGISVDSMDHVWYLNRGTSALPIELTAEGDPSPALCCVRGPELIETDQQGNVVQAWGGPGYIPEWPKSLQTVIVDTKGFVWISGEANEDSILKFTRDGKLVWDFDHRPPAGAKATPENNQETNYIFNKGRFQLDEVANELYIITQKRVLVYDASTGAFKRGWGGHGMPLSEISNKDIPGYTWTGGPPPEEKNFVPTIHFLEISKDRRVYVGERGQNRIEVFTTEGKWLQDIYIGPNMPAQRGECGGLNAGKPTSPYAPQQFTRSICGTMYKMVISNDPEQKYLFVTEAHNSVVWIVERKSGKTLGYFSGKGRLAGQMEFPDSIAIDKGGNIYVGEVDSGKRIQRFAPVLAGAR
jgi:hypothetical protein